MKLDRIVLIVFAIALLLAFGCGKKQPESTDTDAIETQIKKEKVSGTEVGSVIDELLIHFASEHIIDDMSSSLKAALSEAIRDNSIDNAISACYELAPEIAANHSRDGWSIKRVSDKNRNPENVADSIELEFLMQFSEENAPDSIGQWYKTDNGFLYSYYKPIKVAALCINCHGPAENLAPDVAERVNKIYPEDKATGYAIGDLRGMFVVSTFWPDGKDYAQKLVGSDSLKVKGL